MKTFPKWISVADKDERNHLVVRYIQLLLYFSAIQIGLVQYDYEPFNYYNKVHLRHWIHLHVIVFILFRTRFLSLKRQDIINKLESPNYSIIIIIINRIICLPQTQDPFVCNHTQLILVLNWISEFQEEETLDHVMSQEQK